MNLYTQPRTTLTDRDRINAAFRTAGWKIGLDIDDPDRVTFTGANRRGWRDVAITYAGETMLTATLTMATSVATYESVDALLSAAGVRHGQADPDNTDPATTYVCVLTDHLTGAILHMELRSTPPEWDTTDTTDGVWEIRTGHTNGGMTTRLSA